jgi:hypothetical protein
MSEPRPRNRNWIWFFLTLLGLTLLAVAILIWYNFRQQLTPEQLEAAQKLWEKTNLRDYDMEYTTKKGTDKEPDRFEVRVRQGKVQSVILNRRVPMEPRLFPYRSMDALLDDIEKFMKEDCQPGRPRTFTRAMFDPNDGHLLWYVRRVMQSEERVEITVEKFQPITH